MPNDVLLIAAVVVLALVFDFINGFHDTANAIATSVLTQALSIRNAIIMSAMANFIGALVSTGVAKAIGTGIIRSGHGDQVLVLAALVGAIAWNLITWYKGLPSSSSHAIIGGLAGAAVARSGFHSLNFSYNGLGHIVLWLIISPILGFIVGGLAMVILARMFQHRAPSRLNSWFQRIQVLSAGLMAFSHGANDAQKSMGVITLALISLSATAPAAFSVPLWVKLICAGSMAFGTAAGGWRIIKTVGRQVMALQPVHGFAAESSAASVILLATQMHAPVSTTHVITSSVMGVGAVQSVKGVRWGVIRQIMLAWTMTLPISAAMSAGCYEVFRLLFHV